MTVEEVVKSRNTRTFDSLKNLDAAVKNFRRLLKGGYDVLPSYSAFKLLDDMDKKVGDIRVALEVGSEGLSRVAGEASKREACRNVEDESMVEILEEVERRNRELGRELEREKKERGDRRAEADRMGRLLSEYRLEIVRAKDSESRALNDLTREKETVTALRKRLDLAVEALKDAERGRVESAAVAAAVASSAPASGFESPVRIVSRELPSQPTSSFQNQSSISADEEMFTKLLKASNDKLLSDLTEEVNRKLESIVKKETEVVEAGGGDCAE